MKKLLISGLLLGAGIIFAQNIESTPNKQDKELTQKINEIIKATANIKPDMTRGDLLKIYTEEGGLSHRTSRRYAYRGCPYIKVDVKFKAVTESSDEHPDDIIVKISKPFLEHAIID